MANSMLPNPIYTYRIEHPNIARVEQGRVVRSRAGMGRAERERLSEAG